ncbi:uncharacterized protein LOC111249441 isoform X1 [Varroa destructor]|uniref:Uncharacterized protein n=1 Tax=Varroa destructor TaxID=109461 RepID=A0A7M7MG05_VARDE|nr:uncharacterized protein LOC111249441 isoform X1 [Varroa destructor]
MHILRWFRRTSVFSNLIFVDTIMHIVCALFGMFELLERTKESLRQITFNDLRYVLVALCFQLHIIVLSTVFGVRHQQPSGLNAPWWDRVYHVGSLSYYFVMTVFHGMISIYEWQVEQYASCFQHLWKCVCSCIIGYVHELVVTSLILRTELDMYGVSVSDIPRSTVTNKVETTTYQLALTTEQSVTREATTWGSQTTSRQLPVVTSAENSENLRSVQTESFLETPHKKATVK